MALPEYRAVYPFTATTDSIGGAKKKAVAELSRPFHHARY
jgi:hypothetical protein